MLDELAIIICMQIFEREREKFVEKAILNCTEKISFKQYLYDCSCSFASEYINFEESVFSIKIFNYSPVITNVFGLQLNLKQKKQNSWKPFSDLFASQTEKISQFVQCTLKSINILDLTNSKEKKRNKNDLRQWFWVDWMIFLTLWLPKRNHPYVLDLLVWNIICIGFFSSNDQELGFEYSKALELSRTRFSSSWYFDSIRFAFVICISQLKNFTMWKCHAYLHNEILYENVQKDKEKQSQFQY